jgi:hypothetical protein
MEKIELFEASTLLKCLSCRMVGEPPKFDLKPPPPPPLFFQFDDLIDEIKTPKQQYQRCSKYRNILKTLEKALSFKSTQTTPTTIPVIENEFLNQNPKQSILIFIACFSLFLIVLTIAFFLLHKLFKLRKQVKEVTISKSNLQKQLNNNNNNLFQCLSSSNDGRSHSISSSSSSTSSNNSKSNTMNSQLISTPSNSILTELDATSSTSSTTTTTTVPSHEQHQQQRLNNAYLLYRQQLQQHLINQQQQFDSSNHYLQAIQPVFYPISTGPSGGGSVDEYAEINSQCGNTIIRNNNSNHFYNQIEYNRHSMCFVIPSQNQQNGLIFVNNNSNDKF